MRAFTAFALAICVVVVAAGVLLFAGVAYCFFGDPALNNGFLCTQLRDNGRYEFTTLVVGLPVLILLEYSTRNPSLSKKPVVTRIIYVCLTLITIIVLFEILYL